MKNLLKNTFPIDRKTVDKWKKLFLLARKTVSPGSKEVTLQKLTSTLRKWFPLAKNSE